MDLGDLLSSSSKGVKASFFGFAQAHLLADLTDSVLLTLSLSLASVSGSLPHLVLLLDAGAVAVLLLLHGNLGIQQFDDPPSCREVASSRERSPKHEI